MVMKTPGVYIVEKDAFPNSVVQVATAVPAFIGYTEKAINGNVSLAGSPWRITSMNEFHSYFGMEWAPAFDFEPYAEDQGNLLSKKNAALTDPLPKAYLSFFNKKGIEEKYQLTQTNTAFCLYQAMRMFFLNGGGACYVTSIGSYRVENARGEMEDNIIEAKPMMEAIDRLKKEQEPTMVVIPETTRLSRSESIKVQQKMLDHCGNVMKNRFAILDMFAGHHAQQSPAGNPVAAFRNELGINFLDYGAAYYPWVDGAIQTERDFTFQNINPSTRGEFINLLRRSVDPGPLGAEIQKIGAPAVSGDMTISLTKGGTVALTEEDLIAADDDSDSDELTFTVTSKPADMKGMFVDGSDAELKTFTQADIEAGKVSFKHDDSAAPGGVAKVTVKDSNGIVTDEKTLRVEVVSALMTVDDVNSQTPRSIDVTEGIDNADPEKVKILRADKDSDGKIRTVPEVGVWTATATGEITFAPDTEFAGPDAAIRYTVGLTDDTVTDPADLKISVSGASEETGAPPLPTPGEVDKTMRAVVPLYSEIMRKIAERMNCLPPAAAMAGLYTMVDNNRGVWKAPANVSMSGVVAPRVNISHEEQENLNVSTTGKSINAIRPFVGEGTLVWGARTLDGNSLDWRYINVRRTMIMIEESIRLASKAYVFEPNTANTWVTMRSMIENFLTSIWKQGGLAGSVPTDAFSVHVGLGQTMTPVDILEGIMRITVLLAPTRPAEFIEITFQQQMQKS